ncbi:MAG: two-component regulator propeller domain-containing protein, partial [Sphingobacteriaceae bacterium]
MKWQRLIIFLFLSLFKLHGQNTSIALEKIDAAEMTGAFVTALSTDQKGYLWVGTSNGLNRYDGYGFISYRSYKNDTTTLSHPSIKVIKQFSENELLIGTAKGLNAYSFKNNNFKRIKIDTTLNEYKKKNSIQSIIQLKNGTILIGTQAGIMKYAPEQRSIITFDSKKETLLDNCIIQSMCEDKNGTIWIGAKYFAEDGGVRFRVYKFFPKTKKIDELLISGYGSSGHIGISIDYKGTIWVGVDDGLVSINPYDQKQTFYKAPNNFLSNVSYYHSKDN